MLELRSFYAFRSSPIGFSFFRSWNEAKPRQYSPVRRNKTGPIMGRYFGGKNCNFVGDGKKNSKNKTYFRTRKSGAYDRRTRRRRLLGTRSCWNERLPAISPDPDVRMFCVNVCVRVGGKRSPGSGGEFLAARGWKRKILGKPGKRRTPNRYRVHRGLRRPFTRKSKNALKTIFELWEGGNYFFISFSREKKRKKKGGWRKKNSFLANGARSLRYRWMIAGPLRRRP